MEVDEIIDRQPSQSTLYVIKYEYLQIKNYEQSSNRRRQFGTKADDL